MSSKYLAFRAWALTPPNVRDEFDPMTPAQLLMSGNSPTQIQSIKGFNNAVYAVRAGEPLANASIHMYAPLTTIETPGTAARIATARSGRQVRMSARSW